MNPVDISTYNRVLSVPVTKLLSRADIQSVIFDFLDRCPSLMFGLYFITHNNPNGFFQVWREPLNDEVAMNLKSDEKNAIIYVNAYSYPRKLISLWERGKLIYSESETEDMKGNL